MKIKHFIAALALAITATGCNKELDIPKLGNMGGMEDFYKTDADVESALSALYNSWKGIHYNWFFVKNLLSDDMWAGGPDQGDNAILQLISAYGFGTETGDLRDLYRGLYSIIYNANLILDNAGEDSDAKLRARAEAKFFRAWAHFELVTLWGNAPAVDHVLLPSEYQVSNSTPEETWALIEKDLSEAVESGKMGSKNGLNDTRTGIRVTKETAQALLGKAYVFQGEWAEARTALDAVINSGKYELYRGEFEDIWRAVNDQGPESMLEMEVVNDPQNSEWGLVYMMFGWRFDQFNITNINPAFSNLVTAGWGYGNPRKELYQAFVAREGESGYRLNQTMKTYAFLRDEINMPLLEGKAAFGNEGYFFWKNKKDKRENITENGAFQAAQHNNHRIMRYAEVLLLAAEAHVQPGGDAGKAANYINQIRTRARLAPLGSVTMDDVKIEKRLELCAEGTRFQDIVRWGEAATLLANQGKDIMGYNGTTSSVLYSNSTYGFKAGKHELLPIPSQEIQVNPNMKQNPGW